MIWFFLLLAVLGGMIGVNEKRRHKNDTRDYEVEDHLHIKKYGQRDLPSTLKSGVDLHKKK